MTLTIPSRRPQSLLEGTHSLEICNISNARDVIAQIVENDSIHVFKVSLRLVFENEAIQSDLMDMIALARPWKVQVLNDMTSASDRDRQNAARFLRHVRVFEIWNASNTPNDIDWIQQILPFMQRLREIRVQGTILTPYQVLWLNQNFDLERIAHVPLSVPDRSMAFPIDALRQIKSLELCGWPRGINPRAANRRQGQPRNYEQRLRGMIGALGGGANADARTVRREMRRQRMDAALGGHGDIARTMREALRQRMEDAANRGDNGEGTQTLREALQQRMGENAGQQGNAADPRAVRETLRQRMEGNGEIAEALRETLQPRMGRGAGGGANGEGAQRLREALQQRMGQGAGGGANGEGVQRLRETLQQRMGQGTGGGGNREGARTMREALEQRMAENANRGENGQGAGALREALRQRMGQGAAVRQGDAGNNPPRTLREALQQRLDEEPTHPLDARERTAREVLRQRLAEVPVRGENGGDGPTLRDVLFQQRGHAGAPRQQDEREQAMREALRQRMVDRQRRAQNPEREVLVREELREGLEEVIRGEQQHQDQHMTSPPRWWVELFDQIQFLSKLENLELYLPPQHETLESFNRFTRWLGDVSCPLIRLQLNDTVYSPSVEAVLQSLQTNQSLRELSIPMEQGFDVTFLMEAIAACSIHRLEIPSCTSMEHTSLLQLETWLRSPAMESRYLTIQFWEPELRDVAHLEVIDRIHRLSRMHRLQEIFDKDILGRGGFGHMEECEIPLCLWPRMLRRLNQFIVSGSAGADSTTSTGENEPVHPPNVQDWSNINATYLTMQHLSERTSWGKGSQS
eukprot:Nitzschia sp. Nitz4//scaffold231_size31564//21706//24278//NITZ4_007942-RA/size31564-augustus-gene-0.28-mRNA-1//-1//CDS//3329543299//2285//frame0